MKQPSFSTVIFLTIVSVFLFSGQNSQQKRPVTPPPQRQSAPPKPATIPTMPSEAVMPTLFWLPEDIKFPEMPSGSPRTITLLGDPKAEGLYVTRTLIPKGKQIIPHTHADSRTVVVLSGICYYGLGEDFDENRMEAMPSGSFFTEPAGIPHFTWAKEEDVILQTTAVGPSGTQIVPDKKTNKVQERP